MRKNRIVYVSVIVVTVVGYLWLGSVLMLLAGILLLLLALASMCANRATAKKLTITQRVEGICKIGKNIPVALTADSKSFLPWSRVSLQFTFENILFGTSLEQEVWLQADGNREQHFEVPFQSDCCGKIRMYVKQVRCFDVFGLFACSVPCSLYGEFSIYPENFTVSTIIKSRPRSVYSDSMYDQNKRGNDVTDLFGMREYQPGDAVHSIHWKVSEKLDSLIVKEYSSPSRYDTLVLVDLRKNGEDTVCNDVIACAAAISTSLIENGMVHYLGAWYGGILVEEEMSHPKNLLLFLDKILSMRVREEGNLIEELYQLGIWQRYTKIIIVTPVLYAGGNLGYATDITMVVLSDTPGDSVYKEGNSQIVSLSVETLRQGKTRLEL